MLGKREYSTVIFSDDDRDVVTVGSIIMVVTGDKGTYYANNKDSKQWFVKAKTTAFRYWLAKRFINKYCKGICGFDCPSEVY